ncbi:MAG: hypothetical protein Fur0022_17990 [Anaerolineales bacterium]
MIVFALADTLSFSLPVTVSVTLPKGILYPLQPGHQEVSRFFERLEALPIQIPIRNGQSYWLGKTVSLDIVVMGAAPNHSDKLSIKVAIEGQFKAAVREFINTKVDPLVATGIGGLFALLGWVYKQYIEQREKEEQRKERLRKEEKDMLEKLRARAQMLIENFKQTLQEKTSPSAQNAFDDLKKLELKDYALNDVKTMEALLKIRNGQVARAEMEAVFDACSAWPKERDIAFVLGYEGLLKNNPFIRYYLPNIQESNLSQELKERLKNIRELQEDFPKSDPPQKRLFEPIASSSKFLSRFSDKPTKNPFAFLRAEEEEIWLFGKTNCFWHYPLFENLRDSSIPAVIYGEAGAGKTAMALGVSDHWQSSNVLGVYLPDVKEMSDILRPTAKALLAIVAANPVRLGKLSEAELNLFASFLMSGLNRQLVAASVAEIRRNLAEHPQMKKKNKDKDKSKEKKRYWRASAEGSLQTLEQILASQKKRLPENDFLYDDLIFCVRSFGFSTARLVFDFNYRTHNRAILAYLADELPNWHHAGIQTYVFLPPSGQHPIVNAVARIYSIDWTKETLEAVYHHRCSTLIGRGITLNALFSSEALNLALEYALQAPGAPRRFSYLCQQIISRLDVNTTQITLDMVRHGIDEVH